MDIWNVLLFKNLCFHNLSAFLSLISLLISKAITTIHMFIRNTSNGINKKVSTQLITRLFIYEQEIITNVYQLNKRNLKTKFMLEYFSSH